MNDTPQAVFDVRDTCISCKSPELVTLSEGSFMDQPLFGFLSEDPFGEDPFPHLQNARWKFVQCKDCAQKFHANVLDSHWNGIYYNRWISSEAIDIFLQNRGIFGFDADFSNGEHAVERILQLERLTKSIRGSDPVRVLDFGCGDGQFLATCACFGFEGVGVEFSAAREKTKRIEFVNSLDQVCESHGEGHFHAATLFEVLEHLPEPLETLKQIRPLMKTDGVLVLETPNCPNVTDFATREDYLLIDPLGHINAFTPETQETMAKFAGFNLVKPSVVQLTASPKRALKREARRLLGPFLKRYTQQYFIAT